MTPEQNPSLKSLVKDLTSMVKNLQKEVSELKRDKKSSVDIPQQKNKRSCDEEDVGKLEVITDLTTLAMASLVRMIVGRATPRAIPPRRMLCQPKAKPSWRPPPASNLITWQGINRLTKLAPQMQNGLRLQCFHQLWHPSSPRKQ